MKCPLCNRRMKVVDSRHNGRGVRRRHHCKKCNERFTSNETFVRHTMVQGAIW